MKLVSWALVSGRVGAEDFIPARVQGLRAVADLLEARWHTRVGKHVPREEVDFIVLACVALLHGYAFGRNALFTALGREPSEAADEAFLDRMADMVEGYVRRDRQPRARPQALAKT